MSDTGQGGPPLRGTVEDDPMAGWRSTTARPVGDGPRWSATWILHGDGEPSGRGAGTWLGVLLVVIGGVLLLEQLIPGLSLVSLALLGLGAIFAWLWLVRGVVGATVPALVLIGWALARLAVEVGPLTGDGWVPLFVGAGLLVAWAVGREQGARRQWALWLGGLLVLVGAVDATDLLPGVLDAEVLIGLAIIAVGLWFIFVRRRGATA